MRTLLDKDASHHLSSFELNPITVPSNDALREKPVFVWLAQKLREVMEERGLSRRGLPDYVTKVVYLHEGGYAWTGGIPYTFHLRHDDVWSMVLPDEGGRWISKFIRCVPPKLRPREALCHRLRLIYMMLATAHPDKLKDCPIKIG